MWVGKKTFKSQMQKYCPEIQCPLSSGFKLAFKHLPLVCPINNLMNKEESHYSVLKCLWSFSHLLNFSFY